MTDASKSISGAEDQAAIRELDADELAEVSGGWLVLVGAVVAAGAAYSAYHYNRGRNRAIRDNTTNACHP